MMRRAEGYFKGLNDSDLFFQAWVHDKARGSIVFTHGIGEHSESYERLALGIEESGWNLYVWDLRGHGRSSGQRGVIGDFADFSQDLKLFLGELGRSGFQGPLILGGHSMGALILLNLLCQGVDSEVTALFLSSPLLGLEVRVPEAKKKAAEWMAHYLPRMTMYNELRGHYLTRDTKVLEEYEHDPLRHDRVSAPLYLGMLQTMDQVQSKAADIQLPILIQQAGHDDVVSLSKTRDFFNALGSQDKELLVYDKLKHEVFNELGRERVFTDLKRWLGRWTQKK